MKKRIALFALTLVSLFVVSSSLVPVTASASGTGDAICDGIKQANNDGCNGGGAALTNVVANIVNIFSVIIGIVAVIMIMVGGFKYVTAGGDSGKISSAKSTIIYAVIGLIIVAMAQSLVKYVVNQTSNKPQTTQKTN